MAKRPTPKKRKAKSAGRAQHSAFLQREMTRLRERSNSPYSPPAAPKNKSGKALKKITRIKA